MNLPRLSPSETRRLITDTFLGYDHRAKLPEGAFYDMENLSGTQYPLLATRPRRGMLRRLTNPGGLLAKDGLLTVEDGTLCLDGTATPVTDLAPGEKQLVSMGAYVLIFPDKVYYNTAVPTDYGPIEADWQYRGTVRMSLCDRDGEPWEDPTVSDDEPENPRNAALWLDTSGGGRVLRQYSEAQCCWVELETAYTRLDFETRGELQDRFSRYDGVTVEGTGLAELDGEKLLYAVGGREEQDFLVLVGLLEGAGTLTDASLRIRRRLPEMDFVCQCQNRLWGCRWGSDESGRAVNEIYASALGDFKNFHQYLGLSTDSWTASVGSDGPFTGAISFLGHPCFFKEDRVHTVTVSPTGAHRLDETVCRGVQRGSHQSLCVVGETLYYKARGAVCAWQGGFPQPVSEALGELPYAKAVGGTVDGRYWLSMEQGGDWSLFCYDPALGLWHREDKLHALFFAALEDELYTVDADSGALLALKGSQGQPEAELHWMAETGILRYAGPDRQYLSHFDLTLQAEEGSLLEVWLRYDSRGDWERVAQVEPSGSGTLTLPVQPRRCDHLQVRLCGRGEMRLYAWSRVLETGSDR